jgi:hypothetical protein
MPPYKKRSKTRKTKRGGGFFSSKKVKEVEALIKFNDIRIKRLIIYFTQFFHPTCFKTIIGNWVGNPELMHEPTNIDNILAKYKAIEWVYKDREYVRRKYFYIENDNANSNDPNRYCEFDIDGFELAYKKTNDLIDKYIRNEFKALPENEVGPNGRQKK